MSLKNRNYYQRQKSIQRLEQAALALLAEKSYSAIRIEDITKRARLSKGSFYLYFNGKEDLYLQSLRKCFFQEMEAISLKLDGFLDEQDPKQALRAFVEFAFEEILLNEQLKIIFQIITDPPLLKLVKNDLNIYIKSYLAKIERHFHLLGVENATQQAYVMLALLHGLSIHRLLHIAGNKYWKNQELLAKLKEEAFTLLVL